MVLGGTEEARLIAEKLADDMEILVTVTSSYGAGLLSGCDVEVIQQKFTAESLSELLRDSDIDMIIDATHPFASEITSLALDVSGDLNVEYIRFERPRVEYPADVSVVEVEDYEEAAAAASRHERILLTTGSGHLREFTDTLKEAERRVFVRILPRPEFLRRTLESGLNAGNVIAMKGPFSREMNEVICRDYDIDALVTKASGSSGGVKEKLEAADRIGIPVILIDRPEFDYPVKVQNMEQLQEGLNHSI